jgi:hypothetical protein
MARIVQLVRLKNCRAPREVIASILQQLPVVPLDRIVHKDPWLVFCVNLDRIAHRDRHQNRRAQREAFVWIRQRL